MNALQLVIDIGPEAEAAVERFAAALLQDSAVTCSREDAVAALGGRFVISGDSTPPAWILALPEDQRERVLARTFLLGCRRAPGMLQDLEQHRVAGGIEGTTVWLWNTGRHQGSYGIAARRDVVPHLGAQCADEPFASQRYCFYRGATGTLPEALLSYLRMLDGLLQTHGTAM
jgi:hypothetical protein